MKNEIIADIERLNKLLKKINTLYGKILNCSKSNPLYNAYEYLLSTLVAAIITTKARLERLLFKIEYNEFIFPQTKKNFRDDIHLFYNHQTESIFFVTNDQKDETEIDPFNHYLYSIWAEANIPAEREVLKKIHEVLQKNDPNHRNTFDGAMMELALLMTKIGMELAFTEPYICKIIAKKNILELEDKSR